MRVRNKTDQGVFVKGHGVIPGNEEATVQKRDQVKQAIKDGVLGEVSSGSSSTTNEEGDG